MGAAALGGFVASAGCRALPPGRYVVNDVELEGGTSAERRAIRAGIATTETELFLGFIHRVFEAETFDRHVLARDLLRIERYYQSLGYYEAKVTVARVWVLPEKPRYVDVTIRVEPGPPVRTTAVEVVGLDGLAPALRERLMVDERRLQLGEPFVEADFEGLKAALKDTLADHGYAYVQVSATADVDVATHTARARFVVTPGRTARFGAVTLLGNVKLPASAILEIADLTPGTPYSKRELDSARAALSDLGVFTLVEIRGDLRDTTSPVVPLTISVKESDTRSLRLGGGGLFDTTQLNVHLSASWDDRNFLGGLRRLQVNAKPAAIFYPWRFPTIGQEQPQTTAGTGSPAFAPLFAYSLSAVLEQPAFVEARTTGVVGLALRDAPLLLPGPATDSQVIGFLETNAKVGVRREFWDRHFSAAPSLHGDASFPSVFVAAPGVPGGGSLRDGVGDVLVSYPQLLLGVDFRDDRLEPREGFYVTTSLQYANIQQGDDDGPARSLWDFRIRPIARFYASLGPLTFAARFGVGFLFPSGYANQALGCELSPAPGGGYTCGPVTKTLVQDQEVMLFRGMYSGGADSNRGYGYQQIGPQNFLYYRIPAGVSCLLSSAEQTTDTRCYFGPTGGYSMWEASFELRFPLSGALHGVAFIDTSDVTSGVVDLGPSPHLSVGPGLRYDTPVGPLRIDIGVRVPGLQTFGDEVEFPPGNVLGMPIAIQFAVGEAF